LESVSQNAFFRPISEMEVADGSPGQSFLTSDTLASMSISYDHVDSVANEPFNWQQAMATREL
jgi:hypothetical protein